MDQFKKIIIFKEILIIIKKILLIILKNFIHRMKILNNKVNLIIVQIIIFNINIPYKILLII